MRSASIGYSKPVRGTFGHPQPSQIHNHSSEHLSIQVQVFHAIVGGIRSLENIPHSFLLQNKMWNSCPGSDSAVKFVGVWEQNVATVQGQFLADKMRAEKARLAGSRSALRPLSKYSRVTKSSLLSASPPPRHQCRWRVARPPCPSSPSPYRPGGPAPSRSRIHSQCKAPPGPRPPVVVVIFVFFLALRLGS